jgi:hypothetical protein
MKPAHLVITLSETDQDGRDLYSGYLQCAGCGTTNVAPSVIWVLPGLCKDCANRVVSVSTSARHQADLFRRPRYEGYPD